MKILLLGSNGAIGSNFIQRYIKDKKINKIYSVDFKDDVLKKKK